MLQSLNFMRFPGGENEGGGTPSNDETPKAEETASTDVPQEEKGFIDKVKDALQDWSTEDQAEQDLDDRTP